MGSTHPAAAPRLVLGSGSPRRLELLAQLGLTPAEVRAPDINEDPYTDEKPRDYVRRMALEKAQASACGNDEVVLCADTTVAVGRRILGKPADATEAAAFLRLMSGRRHRVITAISVKTPKGISVKDVVTDVKMKRLSEQEIAGYVATNDWQGKAGGYGIQGPAGAFIPWIGGSFAAVMGLPLVETANLLQAAGIRIWT